MYAEESDMADVAFLRETMEEETGGHIYTRKAKGSRVWEAAVLPPDI